VEQRRRKRLRHWHKRGGRHCLRTDTPPPPPDGGVVLERPLDQNSSEPNAVVLPAFAVWIASQLAAFYSVNFTSMSAPNSILSVPFIGRFDPTYPNDGGAS
jgi:hypothetical protein